MSVTPVVPNSLPPFPLETPQDNKTITTLTQSQAAALRYLLNKNDAKIVEDALSHLTAICWKACRGLFIPDGYREYKYTSGDHYETDNTETTRLRNFISEWLFEYFAPYSTAAADKIVARVADFRHIGRKCRNALLNVIRKCQVCGKRKVKQCLNCERRLTHREMNRKHETCPSCGGLLTGNNRLVCKNGCEPLSVRTSIDVCYLEDDEQGAALIEYLTLVVPPSLKDWLIDRKPDLEALGIFEGCRAFITAFAEGGVRDVTAIWCEQHGICDKTARKRRQKFLDRIQELLEHKLVREFYQLIEANGDGAQIVLAVAESKTTREVRKAKSTAARQLSEFYKTVSPEARAESEKAANEVLAYEHGKDSDEINSRRNPEIASATYFIGAGRGFATIHQQEEVKTLLADADLEDVAYVLGLDSASDLDKLPPEDIANALYPIEPDHTEPDDE